MTLRSRGLRGLEYLQRDVAVAAPELIRQLSDPIRLEPAALTGRNQQGTTDIAEDAVALERDQASMPSGPMRRFRKSC